MNLPEVKQIDINSQQLLFSQIGSMFINWREIFKYCSSISGETRKYF